MDNFKSMQAAEVSKSVEKKYHFFFFFFESPLVICVWDSTLEIQFLATCLLPATQDRAAETGSSEDLGGCSHGQRNNCPERCPRKSSAS